MFAAYQTFAFAFISDAPAAPNSFTSSVNASSGNFDDHDDTNIFYSPLTKQWVDLQIIFQNVTDLGRPPHSGRKYCDNAGAPFFFLGVAHM